MIERITALVIASAGPAVFGSIGIVFLRRAGELVRAPSLQESLTTGMYRAATSVDLWVGVACYLVAFAWLMVVIAHVRISQFYPIAVGLNIVLTCMAGVVVLSEPMPLARVLGLVLIILGVALVAS